MFAHTNTYISYLHYKRMGVLIIMITAAFVTPVISGPAKITLFQGRKKGELFTKQCRAGMQLKNPVYFTCACITGVWGFYKEYCTRPVAIAGGDNFCFKMRNDSISQLIPLGNPDYPFEPSLSILTPHFTHLLAWFRSDSSLPFPPSSSFVTVTDTPWTLHSDRGDTLCLKAVKGQQLPATTAPLSSPRRIFCLFDTLDGKRADWGGIVGVSRGCAPTTVVLRADNCGNIKPPNDFADCNFDKFDEFENLKVLSDYDDMDAGGRDEQEDVVATTTQTPDPGDNKIYIDLNDDETVVATTPTPTPDPDSNKIYIDLDDDNDDVVATTTTMPTPDLVGNKIYIDLNDEENVVATTTPSSDLVGNKIYIDLNDEYDEKPVSSTTSTTTQPPPTTQLPPTRLTTTKMRNKIYIDLVHKRKPQEDKIYIDLPKNKTLNEKIYIDLQNKKPIRDKIYIDLPKTKVTTTTTTPTTTTPPSIRPIWFPIKPKRTTTTKPKIPATTATTHSPPKRVWIPIKLKLYTTTTTPKTTTTTHAPKSARPHLSGWIPVQPKSPRNKTTPEVWIPIKPKKKIPPTTTPSPKPRPAEGWIPIKPKKKIPLTTTPKPKPVTPSRPEVWIPIKPKKSTPTTPTPKPKSSSSSSEEEQWIPIAKLPLTTKPPIKPREPGEEATTIPPPDENGSCTRNDPLTRHTVQKFWLSPENNQCSRSLTEAIFTDQLRRYTVKQFDHIFEERLKSLNQMNHLLNLTKEIMLRTCSQLYVPISFFATSFDAFATFTREDFFYGVSPPEPEVYPRIVSALGKCLARAEPHVFEHLVEKGGGNTGDEDGNDCESPIKKISGYQILPGRKVFLKIPEEQGHKNYEILIETSWKMFLNTHSYCWQDFKFTNDHHHFAVLMMELFTKSIWEKWIEPSPSLLPLYSFILPNFAYISDIQNNVDFCVAATGTISSCPVWLDRTSATSTDKHSPYQPMSRKKRSGTIWVDSTGPDQLLISSSPLIRGAPNNHKIDNTHETLGGEAYCLHDFTDQEDKLDKPKCIQVVEEDS